MMNMSRFAAVFLAAALAMGSAHANIWKCRNNETGRIEYSGIPCDGRNNSGDRINAPSREPDAASSAGKTAGAKERAPAESAPSQESSSRSSAVRSQSSGFAVISSCDGSGCWDAEGNRYNAAGSNLYYSASGQACKKVGKQLRCQ